MIAPQLALKFATHRHYKGGLYRFICEAKHTETGEELVIREHVWPHANSIKARPASLFYGKLEDGTERYAKLEKYFVRAHVPVICSILDNEPEEPWCIEKVEDIEHLGFVKQQLSHETVFGLFPRDSGELFIVQHFSTGDVKYHSYVYIGFVIESNKVPGYLEWAKTTREKTSQLHAAYFSGASE